VAGGGWMDVRFASSFVVFCLYFVVGWMKDVTTEEFFSRPTRVGRGWSASPASAREK